MNRIFAMLVLITSLNAWSQGVDELPVRSIPAGSEVSFSKNFSIPANLEEIELSESSELTCTMAVDPVSNRSRHITAGSTFYVVQATQDPPSIKMQDQRNTIFQIVCRPRLDNVRGGEAVAFYNRYAERVWMNYDLSVLQFKSMLQDLINIRYSDSIEIVPNARTLQEWKDRGLEKNESIRWP